MRRVVATWIAATALLMAAPVSAQPPDESDKLEEEAEAEAEAQDPSETDPITKSLIEDAVAHFKEGQRFFEERLYAEAAEEFRRSYESIPSGRALYNESLAWEKAGEPGRALKTLDRYLALEDCAGDELLCVAERGQASRAAEKLRTQVGELDIVLDPETPIRGVEIDGELFGVTAFPLYAEPGLLEVVVVGVKEGQRRRVEVKMEAGKRTGLIPPPFTEGNPVIPPPRKTVGEENGTPTQRRDPEQRRQRLRYAFYGSLAATLASGAALGVVGGFFLDARRDYKRRCTNASSPSGMCGTPDPENPGVVVPGPDKYPGDTERRFRRLQPATTALVIVTAGLALTTVTLALFAFTKGDRVGQRASTRVTKPGAQFTGNGVQIRW